MKSKTITEFLNDEYKEFAFYTIENRAIPSYIDGFKPVQRKIMYIANKIWKGSNDKAIKVFQIGGKVASDSYYHHGDSSLMDAIINMAQPFKNNLPLLEGRGQIGSLRSPESGAPRYVGVLLSKNFRKVYKDFELLEHRKEEGVEIEPYYFLPIIPMVLVNGAFGISVGFSTNILKRDPKKIIDRCINVLKGKKIRNIEPYQNGFTGEYIKDDKVDNKWIVSGKFKIVNTTTVHITELPPSMTHEKYEKILDKLIDDKEISSYDDNCKDNINYVIKFRRNYLKTLSDEDLIKLLKITENESERFCVLDENGEFKIYDSTVEIIENFVKFRLKFYKSRKKYLIDKKNDEIKTLDNKCRFIKLILENKILINNKKRSDIEKQIIKYKLDKIHGSYSYLFAMPIYSLTKEMFEEMLKDQKEREKEIKQLKKMKEKEMYIKDLEDLKKSI